MPKTRDSLLLAMSSQDNGDPLTCQDLARLLGVSRRQIQDELRIGEIDGFKTSTAVRAEWRIEWRTAKSYLERVGALRPR